MPQGHATRPCHKAFRILAASFSLTSSFPTPLVPPTSLVPPTAKYHSILLMIDDTCQALTRYHSILLMTDICQAQAPHLRGIPFTATCLLYLLTLQLLTHLFLSLPLSTLLVIHTCQAQTPYSKVKLVSLAGESEYASSLASGRVTAIGGPDISQAILELQMFPEIKASQHSPLLLSPSSPPRHSPRGHNGERTADISLTILVFRCRGSWSVSRISTCLQVDA
ncbi:unnamed protein product [Closterium sp. NIES-64]|nr:unnamed protein product [Closterium sp. NIES-64]